MKDLMQLLIASVMTLAALDGAAQNLISNGDFSAGNAGFTSGYTFVASGTSATPGTCGIRTNSQSFNPGYNAFADHTTGSGLMLLVDGYTSGTTVWSQTVNVSSNAPYVFSGYAISAGGNPAILQFFVNGVQVGANFNLPTVTVPSTPSWNNFSVGWNSTSNTTATLAIFDANPNWSSAGDDFGLDDLSLSLVILPDLAPVSVSWNNPPVAGQANTLNMVVTNLGNGAASGGWYNQWILSTTTNAANAVANGTFENSYCCFNAPTNGSYTTSIGVTLPAVPAGNYYLIAQADDRNYVYESNENNNSLVVPITLAIPDLVPVSVSWNNPPVAGQANTLNMVVTNLGNGAASGGWYNQWILSTTTNAANAVANGTFENSYCCFNAPTNGSYTASIGVTLPAVPAGTYYLIAQADDRNYVYESNETNNSLAIAITIGNTDLVATNFSLGATAIAGTNLPVSFTVINNGTNAYSSYWYDSVSLSNATLGVVVTNWEFYGYHSLPVSGSYLQSQLIPLPGVAAGTNYYLIAHVDDLNYVAELNKSNNFQVLQVTITNRPPAITLLTPPNPVQQTSCVPVSFLLSAGIQLGSYAITNVTFYDGGMTIGQATNSPYRTLSPLLDHGTHVIKAQALDKFGLGAMATSTISVVWPSQTNVLLANEFSNTCVICMAALNGTNYVIETKTNLTSSAWQPLATNQVTGALLVMTNQQTVPIRFFRTRY